MKKYIISAFALVFALGVMVSVKTANAGSSAIQSPPVALHGWAWSSTIGWVSFNSLDQGTGDGGIGTSSQPYSVSIATTSTAANLGVFSSTGSTNTFHSYAWSPNVGWISFNATDVTPDCGPVATVDLSSGAVSGWARVISEKTRMAAGYNDGWDGCIDLSDGVYFRSPDSGVISVPDSTGIMHSVNKGGVTFKPSTGAFGGFAWSGGLADAVTGIRNGVVGWLSFDAAGPTNSVSLCPDGGCTPQANTPTVTLTANPYQVQSGQSATLSWSSFDVTSCTASSGWSGSKALSGSQSTGNLTVSTSYTLTCTGPDGPASANATVAVVSSPNPTITCDASTQICLKIDNAGVVPPAKTTVSVRKGVSFDLGWVNKLTASDYTCSRSMTKSDGSNSSSLFPGWSQDVSRSGNAADLPTTNVPVGQYKFSISCTEKANSVNTVYSNNGSPTILNVYTGTAQEL